MKLIKMRSICAKCKKAFKIETKDRVFFQINNKTITICKPCQSKMKLTHTELAELIIINR